MSGSGEHDPWSDTVRVASRDELLAPTTQIVGDRDSYLGQGRQDVGRRISRDQVEMFVSGDVAESLREEIIRHAGEFIALHDVGSSAALRLLADMAGAAAAPVQRLTIRREGHGAALAVLPFVEVPLADGNRVRLYATDVGTDASTRMQLARVLLGHSRLGVLMVGALPATALAAQLAPLHDALRRGPWPNRDLLLVPLGPSMALAAHAAQLSAEGSVAAHVTPHASRPRHAWAFISGAWNRLLGQPGGTHAVPVELSRAVPRPELPNNEAATEPMPLRPLHDLMGDLPSLHMPLAAMPVAGAARWHDYAERCASIRGAVGCCIFDVDTLLTIAIAGTPPAPDRMARQGSALLAAAGDAARALGLGAGLVETSVSTPQHHLLIRGVPGHPGIAVHLVLKIAHGGLTLARQQLHDIALPN